jgi:hypothetical protein
MTDKERKELEELRAFKAQAEAKPAELPPLDKRITDDYSRGVAIVDIARRHSVTVERVLELTGNSDLLEVSVIGDQIDPTEIGNQGTYNAGQTYKVNYTVN